MDDRKTHDSGIHIVETLIGVFAVSDAASILEKGLYPPDPKQIAAALERQASGEVTKETAELMEKLMQRGFKHFVFENEDFASAVSEKYHVETEVVRRSMPARRLIETIEGLAIDLGRVEDNEAFLRLGHEVSMLRAKKAVQKAQSKRGAVVTQTVQLLNELDKTLNVLSGKMREWYGLHFPELGRLVESHETYARMVETLGDRGNMTGEALSKFELGDRKAASIVDSARESMGAPLAADDREQIRALVSNILSLYSYREGLQDHIASTVKEVAPNLSEVAGPILAAKLIEKAGSVRKLAMMPSSTIQLLGAEKALFRSKKSRAKPPKHGLIFQHPFVHPKPRKLRGRASRTLAAKLAIAARADAFSGNLVGSMLIEQLK
jgi:nucleolar protein 56